jgi:DNA polymerase III epsilon subunit-like protein
MRTVLAHRAPAAQRPAQGSSQREGLTTLAAAVTLLPFPYVILDLETMDGTPIHDRIIEIALLRFEEGTASDR